MADMIKFFKGLEASLPATGVNGALYITTDEGAIYLGTGTGMKRLGDFVQVDNVASLPEKAHESCLYYCVAENILAKWNGTEWKQINKQPTAEEMKTLLGLGSLAYKSEVAEGDLNADLLAKVNASAEGNHSHSNKDVIDGITADKVTAWDGAEQNAKDYADGLNTAMNTRVEALEAIDHDHANKALLDTYTQTEENLADAVAKKHEHLNKTELDKIAAGDVAKWNGVLADHLNSADKTEFEDSIGDVNTALGEEVTRAKAAEKANADAITGIKNGTAINDFAGVEAELAKKVTKTDYEADKATFATKTDIEKLAGVSTGANKVEKSDTNGHIKIDGEEVVVYTHPEKHAIADVDGLQDALNGLQTKGNYAVEGHKHVKADITDFAHTHVAADITDLDTTIKGYDYATKDEAEGYANAKDEAIAAAKKAGDDAQDAVDALADKVGTVPEGSTVMGIIANIQENAYDDTELRGLIGDNADAIAAEKERAEGIEGGLRADVDAIKGDYLKGEDKTTLEGKITAEETRAKGVEENLQTQINTIMNNPDAEGAINSINEFTKYVEDHGSIAEGMRTDINKNKEDIAAEVARADAAEKALAGRLDTLEAIDHEAYVAADTALKTELEGKITDGDAATLEAAKKDASDKDAVVLSEAQKYADAAKADAIADAEGKVNALAGNVYTKAQTYTQDEVDALIEAAHTWGSF